MVIDNTKGDGLSPASIKAKARKAKLRAEAIKAGHKKMPLSKVIRLKCLDCCCQQAAEVRNCPVKTCPNWPYRFGRSPFYGDDEPKPRATLRRITEASE